jgi:hypothetical protein
MDIHFSRNGNQMYVAALNGTFIVDVSRLPGSARCVPNAHPAGALCQPVTVSVIAYIPNQDPNETDPSRQIELSHQADVSADGKILVVSDEKGGGLSNTDCNTRPNGTTGGLHFYALASIRGVPASSGARPSRPKKLGVYLTRIRCSGRIRCRRPSTPSTFDGVSRLPIRQLVTAWYGAGTWYVDFSRPPSDTDGSRRTRARRGATRWAGTSSRGADTWSSKEYKGKIATGDMTRGFDTFAFQNPPPGEGGGDGGGDED